MPFHVPERNRVTDPDTAGPWATARGEGNYGAFLIESCEPGWALLVLATDGIDPNLPGYGWEHVSVSARRGNKVRTPTWAEMCLIKDRFWDAEDPVMQLHPRRSQYVNNHPHTLHLWRPFGEPIPEPPTVLV